MEFRVQGGTEKGSQTADRFNPPRRKPHRSLNPDRSYQIRTYGFVTRAPVMAACVYGATVASVFDYAAQVFESAAQPKVNHSDNMVVDLVVCVADERIF